MALPGVVDPLTGATTANPLDPTNPASGQSTVPPLIDLSQGVGLTGADAYNVQRLTRAQTYLSGSMQNYADLATTEPIRMPLQGGGRPTSTLSQEKMRHVGEKFPSSTEQCALCGRQADLDLRCLHTSIFEACRC